MTAADAIDPRQQMAGGLPQRLRSARVVAFGMTGTEGVTVIDGRYAAPLPPASLARTPTPVPALLGRVAPLFAGAREGVVLVDEQHAAALGLPAKAYRTPSRAADNPTTRDARAFGWNVSRIGPWSTFWSPRHPSVHLGVVPWIDPDQAGPLFAIEHARDACELSWHLARFHQLTGGAYHGTPGVSGVGLLRDHTRHRKAPYWQPDGVRKWGPATQDAEHDVIGWARTGAERDGQHEHRYDANLAYLNALGMVTVASDDLVRGHRAGWAPARAGYWRIKRPAWNEPRMPNPLGFRNDAGDGPVWVTSPTMVLLHQLAGDGYTSAPEVLDSWTAPAVRLLRSWADTMVQAIAQARESDEPDDRYQVAAIKAAYREGIGMLGHDGSRVYRPDWRHAVVALTRANLWRKAWKVAQTEGRWPSAFNRDAVSYRSNESDPVAACPRGLPLGDGLGTFKVEESR